MPTACDLLMPASRKLRGVNRECVTVAELIGKRRSDCVNIQRRDNRYQLNPYPMAERRGDQDHERLTADSTAPDNDDGAESGAGNASGEERGDAQADAETVTSASDGAAAAGVLQRSRIFDIVLQSPTAPTAGIPLSLMTSPASPSAPSSMTSSTDNIIGAGGTACFGDERRMLADLGRRFYNRRLLSDVRLRVGDRIYRAHKLLLARASDVLERMLCSSEWNESVKQVGSIVEL
jgi:BTB/POZ domain